MLFAPSAEELYPPGFATWVEPDGAAEGLEGEHRPGHFRGVATVCVKLFTIVRPHVAYFGRKDAQQVAVVKQVVRDLDLELEIRVVPTVRDADGLALSSRNARLSPDERARALAMPRALETRDPARARDVLAEAGIEPDYVAVADLDGPTLAVAARIGSTRLIDNVLLEGARNEHPPRTPAPSTPAPGKLPLPELVEMKRRGDKIAMVTAYDAPAALLADRPGVELILVGDTAAMVMLGHESTVPVTLDEMIFLTRAVTRAARRPLVVGDLPFGTYEVSDEQAVASAIRLVKEGGADVVKLEGAGRMVSRVRAIAESNIGVMGHVGLTPQSATKLGGFRAQGRTADAALKLYEDALALQDAGCFAIVLEAVPAPVAARITRVARDPDDRHRRRRRLRRPGARLARPARHVRGPHAALRQALRRARGRDRRRRSTTTSPTCAAARSPRSSTPTRSRTTSSRGSRSVASLERAERDQREQPAARPPIAIAPAARPHVQPCTARTPITSSPSDQRTNAAESTSNTAPPAPASEPPRWKRSSP